METDRHDGKTPPRRRRRWLRPVLGTGVAVLLFAIWGLLLGGNLSAREVISPSMEPTILVGDRLIVERLDPEDALHVGDIVIIEPPDGFGLPLVKRIAAGPGDEVWAVAHHTWINRAPTGKQIAALDLKPREMLYLTQWRLKAGEFFVLGDNRGESYDSTLFGPVERPDVVARVLFRYAPLGKAGPLPRPNGDFPRGSRYFPPD